MKTYSKIWVACAIVLATGCLSFTDGTPRDGAVDAPPAADARVDGPVQQSDAACVDTDGDGYFPSGCTSPLLADCAEGDAARHPGALEVCGNDVDENCDGTKSQTGCIEPLAVTTSSGRIVQNNVILIHFDDTNGWLPSELRVVPNGTDNLLQMMPAERGMGTHGWPNDFQYEVTPTFSVRASGGAVFRLRVDSPNVSADEWSVLSHYTVFPDGRVHRNTEFTVAQQFTGGYQTVYAAMNGDLFTNAACSYDTAMPLDPGNFVTVCEAAADSGQACVYNTTSNLMVGMWHSVSGGSFNGPRITESTMAGAGSHSLSLIFDFYQNQTVPVGQYSLDSIVYGEVAADGVAAASCGGLPGLANWLSNPASLSFANGEVMHPGDRASGDDGMDGYYEGGGFWAIDAATGSPKHVSFTISGGVEPQHAAFRIHRLALARTAGGYYMPEVRVNGTYQVHGIDYLWHGQDDPDNGSEQVGWLYFNKTLASGDQVSIDVPGM